jgi:hypothetical protein
LGTSDSETRICFWALCGSRDRNRRPWNQSIIAMVDRKHRTTRARFRRGAAS